MKLTIHGVKQNPSCVEEIVLENVSDFSVNDNFVTVNFNGEPTQIFIMTNTEQEKNGDWIGLSLFATKVGLKIEGGKL